MSDHLTISCRVSTNNNDNYNNNSNIHKLMNWWVNVFGILGKNSKKYVKFTRFVKLN